MALVVLIFSEGFGHDEDVSAYGKFEVFKAKEKLNQPSQIEAL